MKYVQVARVIILGSTIINSVVIVTSFILPYEQDLLTQTASRFMFACPWAVVVVVVAAGWSLWSLGRPSFRRRGG